MMKAENSILVKILCWTPRIIVILAVLFVSMFALDSFSPNLTIWQQLLGFSIHLIPTYVLLIFLFVAWKWELIGGILFTIISLVFSPIIYNHNFKMNHSVAISLEIILLTTFPFFVAGVLFIINHFVGKKLLNIHNTNLSQKLFIALFFTSLTTALNSCGMFFENKSAVIIRDKLAGDNLGFEFTKNELPVNWYIYAKKSIADCDVIIDKKDFIEGLQSLKFVVRKCNTQGHSFPGFFKEFERTPGAIYKVSFWIKNTSCKYKIIISAVRPKGGAPCPVTSISNDENIDVWKQFNVTHKICDDMNRLRFEVILQSPGTFQIDGLQYLKQ